MDDDQQFCLRWNNHQSTLISVFDTLLENGTLVDCTLAAEGKFLKAHKVVLSACSPYFATLLSQQYDKHPIFILKDVKFQELRAMMDYMYRGEVNISQDQLAALLKAAESLQIKGLSDSRGGASSAVSGSAGICASQKSDHKALSVPVTSGPIKSNSPSGGYTIEQKRPRHAVGASSSIESQAGSREGSSSPTSRKRKRIRRRSMDNLTIDNHEHSNSSSQSMQINSSVAPSNTSTAMGSVPSSVAVSQAIVTQQTGAVAGTSGIVTAGTNTGLNVTKKTDSVSSNAKLEGAEQEVDNDNGDEEDESGKLANMRKEQNKRKQHTSDVDQKDSGGEILIEPKSEYDDGNDETVEDLTLDDEELLEDLEQAGPSHGGGEGSSQGYAQWQVERSQDDVFMATQESAGQQRDPQGEGLHKRPKSPPSSPDDQPCDLRLITTATIKELVAAATSTTSAPTLPLTLPPPLPALAATAGTSSITVASTTAATAVAVGQTAGIGTNYANLVAAVAAAATSPISKLSACLTTTSVPQTQQQLSTSKGSGVSATASGSHQSPLHAVKFCSPIGIESMQQAIGVNLPPSGGLPSVVSTASLTSPLLSVPMNSGSTSASNLPGAGNSSSASGTGGWGAFTCPRCGNSYARPHSLNRHIRFECGVEPKFECPICHKKSKHKHNLVLHMRTHQNR